MTRFDIIAIGDLVRVVGQDIVGKVVKIHSTTVVIEDATLPDDDNLLEFRYSEIQHADL